MSEERWTNVWRLIPLVARFARDAFRAGPSLTIAILTLRLTRAAMPLAIFWFPKLILDTLLKYLRKADSGVASHIFHLVALQLVLVILNDLLGRGSTLCEGLLGERFTNLINERLIAHAATLDYAHFETPLLYDKLERARNQAAGRLTLLLTLLNLLQEVGTLSVLILGFIVISKWLVLLVIISIVPSLIHEPLAGSIRHTLLHQFAAQRRQLEYLRTIGTTREAAKEVRVLSLGRYLSSSYSRVAGSIYQQYAEASIKRMKLGAGINVVSTCSYFSAYVWAIWRVMIGAISPGTFAFIAQSFSRSLLGIERTTSGFKTVYENALLLSDLFEFFDLRPTITDSEDALTLCPPLSHGIEFRHVTFRYPGTDKIILHDVSFEIELGRRVALVGENGCGKSTIVKLLARLYDPTDGTIFVNGVDLRSYTLDSVRRQVATLFQDFARFDMSLRENVMLGNLDVSESSDELERALVLSGATTVVSRLPLGIEQMLGRRFEGGVDLSGGEWQRVSLARTAVRNAAILVLDEPNASLDSRSEKQLLERFGTLTENRTVLLISHQLATCRAADKVVVMASGRIVEEGTHDHLIEENGLYAELYGLQAEKYQ